MPLPPPAPRRPSHTRVFECNGYEREDGLWDIEGRITDTKHFDFENTSRDGGVIRKGEPLHHMELRLTIDETGLIHAVACSADWGPFAICPGAAAHYARLEGLRIAPGFTRKVAELFSGTGGCTHITELLGRMAQVTFQTLWPTLEAKARLDPSRERPAIIGRCHALAADGPVVKDEWPQFYEGE